MQERGKKVRFAKIPLILIIIFFVLLLSGVIIANIIGMIETTTKINFSRSNYLESVSLVAYIISPFALVVFGIWALIMGLIMLKNKDERRVLTFINLIVGIIILILAILFYFSLKNFSM